MQTEYSNLDEVLNQQLNPCQIEAAKCTDGPLLILAGAGSGKTRTITYRIWYLIEQKGVSPWHILAVTFTNKAAQEMRNRVQTLLHSSKGVNVWVSTFHSACVRILRQHITRLNMDNSFAILDGNDQVNIIKKSINAVDSNAQSLSHYAVLGEIRKAKNELITSGKYAGLAGSDFFRSRVARVFIEYERYLRENNLLDFDDLLLLTCQIFQQIPDVLEYYQDRCRYILVDEYQDTNQVQARILHLLAGKHQNICVVGDDDQSIYRWRGADIHNILNFEHTYPQARVIHLEQNYRSTKIILDAANEVIANNEQRKYKKLWTTNEDGSKINLYEAMDEQEESKYISRQIQSFYKSDFPHYRDFAVLYRINAQSRAVEEALRNDGIPYTIVGGLKFYERKEIKDLIAYLKTVSNPDNRLSLTRIINIPPRRIGHTTLAKIEAIVDQMHISMFQAIGAILKAHELTSSQKDNLANFLQFIQKWRVYKNDHTVSQLLDLIVKDIHYMTYLEEDKEENAEARIENVKELFSGIRYFERRNQGSSLEEFLDYVSLLSDIDEYSEESGTVSLMTIHSAKGLEFPVVFMVGMEENLFPSRPNTITLEELEEERRLCYVGMTRARKSLFLSRAKHRTIYGNSADTLLSRFVKEIPSRFFNQRLEPVPRVELINYSSYQKKIPDYPTGDSVTDYQIGDWVHHEQWGKGTIFSQEGEGENKKVMVNFGGLRKKLMVKYARLQKI